jgi:hypothetical protein
MRSDIAPGRTFPEYELPDHENVPRRLSDLQGEDQLILDNGWDLAGPGLREAWDAGTLSRFHGWDKRTATSV